jgi:hypothetical protein
MHAQGCERVISCSDFTRINCPLWQLLSHTRTNEEHTYRKGCNVQVKTLQVMPQTTFPVKTKGITKQTPLMTKKYISVTDLQLSGYMLCPISFTSVHSNVAYGRDKYSKAIKSRLLILSFRTLREKGKQSWSSPCAGHRGTEAAAKYI